MEPLTVRATIADILDTFKEPEFRTVVSQSLSNESGPIVVLNEDQRVEDLAKFLPRPREIDEKISFSRAVGFVLYVKRFAQSSAVVFAKEETFCAMLDYHTMEQAAWCRHVVKYSPRRSPEWLAWENQQGKAMTQQAFALFLEENIENIEAPNGGELLGLIRTFYANVTKKFTSVLDDNGQVASLKFQKDVTTTAGANQADVPKELTIVLRPYLGIEGIEMNPEALRLKARISYEIADDGSGLKFQYKILSFDRAKELGFLALCDAIKAKTELSLYLGGDR